MRRKGNRGCIDFSGSALVQPTRRIRHAVENLMPRERERERALRTFEDANEIEMKKVSEEHYGKEKSSRTASGGSDCEGHPNNLKSLRPTEKRGTYPCNHSSEAYSF